MYKIMLVDDDYLVLEYLRKMIPWADLGFQVVGLCEDGQQALMMMSDTNPDVIMTDIGMPKKDGITLIKEVIAINPKVKSVFLTCYDDFGYAQTAIRLNSFDYILKETFDPESITQMMLRLKEELDKEAASHTILNNMKFFIKENLTVLRSKLLERLITGDAKAISAWLKKHEHELELNSTYKNCMPILSFIDDYEQLLKTRYSEDALKFAIDNVIAETLSRSGTGYCLFYKEDTFFIFYARDAFIAEGEIQQAIREIHVNLRKFLKLSITSIIGNNCTFPDGLTGELNAMLAYSAQRFYLKPGSIIEQKQISFSAEYPLLHAMDSIQALKRLILHEDLHGLDAWVQNWTSMISKHQYEPDMVKQWVRDLLFEVEKMIRSLQHVELESMESVVHRSIAEAKTVKQLAEWLADSLHKAVAKMKDVHDLPKKEEIIKAQKYVLLNLDKKITLGDVAAHLHLNPSYFSRIFKQHAQMNFIDYVNQMKIEEAKKLIDNTNESTEKIADKLGFEDKGYFIKVFKKYFGASPMEYKRGTRKE